ncbi:MAG: GTPase HflX [Eubacteriales bacterium]
MTDEKIFDKSKISRAVLVSVIPKGADEREYDISFDELERLSDTAGAEVVARLMQQKENPDPRTYIGKGKLTELSELCEKNDMDIVIFDDELSPSQIKNIENDIEKDVRVIDRSMLILDIFALHAVSGEGKTQVELAQLKYTVPRLTGKGSEMSRLGGGIGTRGPGESKLETDRRHIKRRIASLENDIKEMAKNRAVQRNLRDRSGIFKIAIAGYTNAGKSTLLNFLTNAGILAEDKLFATLDPTTRKYTLPDGDEVLLTDTVGFIRRLPHQFVNAFRSTLDEVVYADAIMLVIDASDTEADSQASVCMSLIEELGAADKPIIYVYNKCDVSNGFIPKTPTEYSFLISAKTGEGISSLVSKISELAHERSKEYVFEIPHAELGIINRLYENTAVKNVEYTENGALVTAVADTKNAGIFAKYIKKA